MLDKIGHLLRPPQSRQYKLFQIEPSLECNLECVMCPWRELRPEEALMSEETFARIAEYLPVTASVDFTGGGEPTTNPRLAEMVRTAKAAGCEVGFSTNATLLDRGLAETLVALEQDWISFSVDGATAETYENIRQGAQFQTVTGNIQRLREIKLASPTPDRPKMMMVFVMMRQNFHELPLYVELAHSLGVEQIIFKNLDVILKEEDDRRRLFSHDGPRLAELEPIIAAARQRARQLGVGLRLYELQPRELPICEHDPLHNLFFNWAGFVSPCITLSYAAERVFNGEHHVVPCQQYGNINRQTLEEIWQEPAYHAFRQPYETRVRLERQAMLDALVGSAAADRSPDGPPAPEGCRTCYYLYGI